MIRITVELLPHGMELGKRTLGIAEISNDGTGTVERGNYKVTLSKWAPKERETWKETTVRFFPRTERGTWDLLYRALRRMVGSRNPE